MVHIVTICTSSSKCATVDTSGATSSVESNQLNTDEITI